MYTISVKNLRYTAIDKELFQDMNFILNGNDRIALIGENGVGKTTLIKLLTGDLEPVKGISKLGVNLKIGRFEQHNDFGEF